eukprot:Pgem_evm1s9386
MKRLAHKKQNEILKSLIEIDVRKLNKAANKNKIRSAIEHKCKLERRKLWVYFLWWIIPLYWNIPLVVLALYPHLYDARALKIDPHAKIHYGREMNFLCGPFTVLTWQP